MSSLVHLMYRQNCAEWTHLQQSKHSGFRLDWAQAKAPSMETFWADENRCWPEFGHVFFFPLHWFAIFTTMHTQLKAAIMCV